MDLKGQLSNPRDKLDTLAAQGSEQDGDPQRSPTNTRNGILNELCESPREEKGRLSNPTQRRLSRADIDELVVAYQAGATISQLAADFGIHRTTVAAHLDRHGTPRHSEQTAWNIDTLKQAARLYSTGLSLVDVADQFGIDPQTVANRFRRAGVPVRPRRGWSSHVRSEHEQR